MVTVMGNKDTTVLRLINAIDSGRLSPEVTKQKIDVIEKKFGPLNMLYDVDDRDDDSYYEELLTNARLGIFNRDSIIKMAAIKYCSIHSNRYDNIRRLIVCGIVGIAIIVFLIIYKTEGGII